MMTLGPILDIVAIYLIRHRSAGQSAYDYRIRADDAEGAAEARDR